MAERIFAAPAVETSSSRADVAKANVAGDQPVDLSPAAVRPLVTMFKLLADRTRLQILLYLMHRGELNVRSICDLVRKRQPTVSHQLAMLKEAGLVDVRREGKCSFYRIVPERLNWVREGAEQSPAGSRVIRFDEYVLRFRPT